VPPMLPAPLVRHRAHGMEVMRADGCGERILVNLSINRILEQARKGLPHPSRSYYFFGPASCLFACACGRSLRRVSASCALKG
jgi:hypothetical protein